MTTITALPTAPDRADPSTFDTRADAWAAALGTWTTEANTVAGEVNTNASTASTAATTATTQAGTATTQAGIATAAAVAADASADAAAASAITTGAVLWVSGTTYAVGNLVYSPLNYMSYRRRTAGAGTTDPSLDSTNWQSILGFDIANPVPQLSKSADYTMVLADAGYHVYHPSADTSARTWTIPSNASVPFPIGTALTFANDTSGGTITIAITSDTMVLTGTGLTGSRTLAANCIATALKVTATRWMISGVGLT